MTIDDIEHSLPNGFHDATIKKDVTVNKEYVKLLLETDMNNPGAMKSGEYLEELITNRSFELKKTHRSALVEVFSEWIKARSEPRTMLAVRVSKEISLAEMIPCIQKLRDDVAKGRAFPNFLKDYYLNTIDDVLSFLKIKPQPDPR